MRGFALKIAALVVVTVVAAVAATAGLTLREATRQAEKSAEIAWDELNGVVQDVTVYGLLKGSWDGIGSVLPPLASRIGQRVRVVTIDGTVLADTAPGPDPRQTVPVQTRPELSIKAVMDGVVYLAAYRAELKYGRCLRAHGLGIRLITRSGGLLGFESVTPAKDCDYNLGEADYTVARPPLECGSDDLPCVRTTVTAELARLTPPPVLVQVGAVNQPQQARFSVLPVLGIAGLVVLLALVVALLISRRTLRPIGTLAAVAHRYGSGDLSERVPERGDLAELSRAFNAMADSLQRSREQQHNMIADIAHELRTPLANIRGYVEGVRDGVLPANDDLYRSLHEEALLQQRLIDDLQDLALAESGSLVYHVSPVDLADLVAAYPSTVVEAESVVVDADPDRLRQVIGNLVTNARRAGASVITLRAKVSGEFAVVEVEDDGSGIAAEDLPRVFDRFWRADTARGRDTGGRGLGLAIAREIITAHGGTIAVASTLGAGTTVTVRLPLRSTG